MKKIILFIVAVVGMAAQAQTSQRAKNFLDEVNKKIESYSTISVDFTYIQNDEKTGNISQSGKGHIDLKGNLYRLTFMDIIRLYDGQKIYTISEEDEEVTVSKHDPKK